MPGGAWIGSWPRRIFSPVALIVAKSVYWRDRGVIRPFDVEYLRGQQPRLHALDAHLHTDRGKLLLEELHGALRQRGDAARQHRFEPVRITGLGQQLLRLGGILRPGALPLVITEPRRHHQIHFIPAGCRVTILADRGFGDQKLFAFLAKLGFGYVIRFRGNIHVTDADGTTRPATEWAGKGGRARKLTDARVTAKGQQVGAVVCVHAKDMKEPWCLATSERDATAATLINHYAKRWTIEPQFRDTKDLRFGMGLSSTRVGEPMRRDRLLLVSAFATTLLTLLGAVGESLGMDRLLKSNTSKTRTLRCSGKAACSTN